MITTRINNEVLSGHDPTEMMARVFGHVHDSENCMAMLYKLIKITAIVGMCFGLVLFVAYIYYSIGAGRRKYFGEEAWEYRMVFHHPNEQVRIQSVLSSSLEGSTLWKQLKIKEKAEEFVAFENFGKEGEAKEVQIIGNTQSGHIHLWENHVYMEMGKEYEDFNGIKLKAESDGIHVYNRKYQYVLNSMPRLDTDPEKDERFFVPPSIAIQEDDKEKFEVFYRTIDNQSLAFWKHQLF